MIQLNITIGGNLEIALNKGCKEDLKELIEKASNTDLILGDLLEAGNYLGNGWEVPNCIGLTEAPAVAFGSIYANGEGDYPIDYERVFYYPDYMINSFAEILLKEKRVIFKKA